MSRKKSTVETNQPPRGAKPAKMETYHGKHTITYEAPVNVPVVETEQDPDAGVIEDEDFEEMEEIQEQPEHKEPPLHLRLRQRFRRRGITGEATLMVRIDRLPNFERDGLAGVRVDKEFCGVITTTEKFFDNDTHLIEIQRRYGPGAYWLTVRYKNAIVDSWRENIGGFPVAASSAPVAPEIGPSPQVIYQPAPNQTQQPIAVQDPLAHLRQAFKLVRELKEDLGLTTPPQSAPPPTPTDPKVAALQLITENPDVMEKIGSGIARTVLGSRGESEGDPWAEVAKEAIRSGQAPQIVANIVREVMAPFRNLWGNNNGQAQDNAQHHAQTKTGTERREAALLDDQRQMEANVRVPATSSTEGMHGAGTEVPTLEEQALWLLIDQCKRRIPPKVAYDRLMAFAGQINDEAPHYSIDAYLLIFSEMPLDAVIEFVNTQPGGAEVVALPYMKTWTEELQILIRESQEGESED